MNAEALTRALGGRWLGSYGTARCPGHDDRAPSLSIRDGADGEPMFTCFASCDWRDIKDVLRARGLLPERARDPGHRRCRYRPPTAPRPRPVDIDQQQRSEFARRIWHEAIPLANTPAEVYLRERGLKPGPDGWPPSLRYHAALKHGPTELLLPAMLGAVAIWSGDEVVGLHRTFLRADGKGKAPVSSNKMMLGRCGGGAVRLAPAGPELILSEGIETGLSVQQATNKPVWATLSTSGLRSIILPPGDQDRHHRRRRGRAGREGGPGRSAAVHRRGAHGQDCPAAPWHGLQRPTANAGRRGRHQRPTEADEGQWLMISTRSR